MPPRLGQTRATLLERLHAQDSSAWTEFVALYREAIIRFCLSRNVQLPDAEDIAQSVLSNLARTLPSFEYDPAKGRFRDYLFRCIRSELSKLFATRRPHTPLEPLVPIDTPGSSNHSEDSALEQVWEREWVQHHFRLAMSDIRETFEPRSVEIFNRSLAGASIRNLASEFSTTEEAVHKIRQRIRHRLEELISQQVAAEELGASQFPPAP